VTATTLNIRKIDADAAARAKRAASARGLTLGEYFARLVDLHDAMRALADTETADSGLERVCVELAVLGLDTVRA
jgi:hypothetical protein